MPENHFTPLRQSMYLQYDLCRYSVPTLITAKLDASGLFRIEREGSVTAYLLSAFSRALKRHPRLNASFARKRFAWPWQNKTQIVQFDTVDAAVSVDKVVNGERYPFTYILRNADQMSVAEIDATLRRLVNSPGEEIPEFQSYMRFTKLPMRLRRFLMMQAVYDKKMLSNKIGSFNFTNVGKWQGLEHVFTVAPRLVVALGHGEKGIFPVSYTFNHVINDGAQIGEFHQDVADIFARMDFPTTKEQKSEQDELLAGTSGPGDGREPRHWRGDRGAPRAARGEGRDQLQQ